MQAEKQRGLPNLGYGLSLVLWGVMWWWGRPQPEAELRSLLNAGYLLSLLMWGWLCWTVWRGTLQAALAWQARRIRQLHPRSPRDCPICAAKHKAELANPSTRQVEAWETVKSRRGRPKTVESDGYCCDNPACAYYGVTDGSQHALTSHGRRGKQEAVQYWKCGACGRVTTARRRTAMYRLHTPAQRVSEVMAVLAEGMDQAAGGRVFGHDPRTVQRWLKRAGKQARGLHAHFFHHLICQHLQLDELVTKLRGGLRWLFIWVALEAKTKIIPVIHLGQRTNEDAQRFVHELWERLAPHAPLPVFATDGLRAYYNALTAHFGRWVGQPGKRWPQWEVRPDLLYAQLHKLKAGYRLRGTVTRVLCGSRAAFEQSLTALGFSGRVTTALIERFNLTLREHVAPLTRRTLTLARDLDSLALHLEWFRAYYHFVLPHDALRIPMAGKPGRYRKRTPAMAAGLARRRWRVRDLLLMPLPPV